MYQNKLRLQARPSYANFSSLSPFDHYFFHAIVEMALNAPVPYSAQLEGSALFSASGGASSEAPYTVQEGFTRDCFTHVIVGNLLLSLASLYCRDRLILRVSPTRLLFTMIMPATTVVITHELPRQTNL